MSSEEVTCYKTYESSTDWTGCFQFYLNYWSFGIDDTWPQYDIDYNKNMSVLSYCIGAFTVIIILLISRIQFLAFKKHKQIDQFFSKIKDKEFV